HGHCGKNVGGAMKKHGNPFEVAYTNLEPRTVIATIQGNGATPNVVTVDTSVAHNLVTGDKINIVGTLVYEETSLVVTVVTATQFTYQTSAHTEADQEVVGNVQERAFDNLLGDNTKTDAAIQDEVYADAVAAGKLNAGTTQDYAF
ncbi:hypothetical protein LCGC14_2914090, partial [marine sediment metagenome]